MNGSMHTIGYDLDIALLKSFLKIAETGSFTQAADAVGRTQSAVSLQIKKLEEMTGKKLLERTNKQVALTPEGETLLAYARRMILLSQELKSQFEEMDVEGEIRLGTPEDFATVYLPKVLAKFAHSHPRTQLTVDCNLTAYLQEGFHQGNYDIVLLKREPSARTNGIMVWHEPLVWVSGEEAPEEQGVLPLVLSPQPCVYRKRALSALEKAHRPWRVAYTSPSLAGSLAAVRSGLGVTILPKDMVPEGLRILGAESRLPTLPDTEIALLQRPGLGKAGRMLAEHVIRSLERV